MPNTMLFKCFEYLNDLSLFQLSSTYLYYTEDRKVLQNGNTLNL